MHPRGADHPAPEGLPWEPPDLSPLPWAFAILGGHSLLVSVAPEAHLGINPYTSQSFLIHCVPWKFPEACGQGGFHCLFMNEVTQAQVSGERCPTPNTRLVAELVSILGSVFPARRVLLIFRSLDAFVLLQITEDPKIFYKGYICQYLPH